MILDLGRFIQRERPYWTELEKLLHRFEAEPNLRLPLNELRHFHYLYERTSADLARLATFSSEPESRRYLENLVSRAYGEIHETRQKQHRLAPWHWFFQTLPQTFRRHIRAFWLALAVTIAGCLLGGIAVTIDPEAKQTVLPQMFLNHLGDPAERVAEEEAQADDPLAGRKGQFSARLMQNNISVSINSLALGLTYGVGTIIVLFYNGVIIGLIALDYILAGHTRFLLAWLMPHGVIEIPAILISGQAGLVLAGALIGWGTPVRMAARLRAVTADLVTLIFGVAVLLVWAGIVEAFLSQYHEPILPYWFKIAFGSVELVLLLVFLGVLGRQNPSAQRSGPDLNP